MKQTLIYLYVALLGGFAYCTIEIIYRGYTHYSMLFAGAITLSSFYYISKGTKLSFFKKCVAGCVIITSIELVFGIVFNMILKQNVWDYSNTPLNFLGQICLPFSLIWLCLSAVAFKLLEKLNFKNSH